jgi:hypothetical protein
MTTIYNHWCEDCSKTFAESKERKTCPKCKGKVRVTQIIYRDRAAIKPTGHKTVYSRSLGIDPSQVEEAVRMHPDETYRVNEKEGIAYLEIHGDKHREKMAQRHGMVVHAKMPI